MYVIKFPSIIGDVYLKLNAGSGATSYTVDVTRACVIADADKAADLVRSLRAIGAICLMAEVDSILFQNETNGSK